MHPVFRIAALQNCECENPQASHCVVDHNVNKECLYNFGGQLGHPEKVLEVVNDPINLHQTQHPDPSQQSNQQINMLLVA